MNLTAAAAFPPRASGRARALSAQLASKIVDAQLVADQLFAEGTNADEIELLLSGPALLASMLSESLEDRIWASWHRSPRQLTADLEYWRLLANPPEPEAERLAA